MLYYFVLMDYTVERAVVEANENDRISMMHVLGIARPPHKPIRIVVHKNVPLYCRL